MISTFNTSSFRVFTINDNSSHILNYVVNQTSAHETLPINIFAQPSNNALTIRQINDSQLNLASLSNEVDIQNESIQIKVTITPLLDGILTPLEYDITNIVKNSKTAFIDLYLIKPVFSEFSIKELQERNVNVSFNLQNNLSFHIETHNLKAHQTESLLLFINDKDITFSYQNFE